MQIFDTENFDSAYSKHSASVMLWKVFFSLIHDFEANYLTPGLGLNPPSSVNCAAVKKHRTEAVTKTCQ